jgi:hypothetical protein
VCLAHTRLDSILSTPHPPRKKLILRDLRRERRGVVGRDTWSY